LGGTTYFPFSGYEEGPGSLRTKYIRIGIENIASKKSTGEKLFYHNDHLGGVNVITNDTGLLAQIIEYDPWGKVSRQEGSGDSLRRFTGKILDPESGLYYYGGRYYDPELGRFISPDPFVGDPFDPQNLNRYSYVVNNPVNAIDPDGYNHQPKAPKKKKKCSNFFCTTFGRIFGAVLGIGLAWALGPAGFGLVSSHMLAGAIAGATMGAINTATVGGNPFRNIFWSLAWWDWRRTRRTTFQSLWWRVDWGYCFWSCHWGCHWCNWHRYLWGQVRAECWDGSRHRCRYGSPALRSVQTLAVATRPTFKFAIRITNCSC